MKLFDKFKKPVIPIQKTNVQSIPIYNGKNNFIVLVQYNDKIWYEVLEFVEAAMRSGVSVVISHTAETVKLDNTEFEANKPIEFINQRYYLIASGSDMNYFRLFNNLSLSNPILETLQKDIQANRSHADYGPLFAYNVLDKSKFAYHDILPTYDEGIKITDKLYHDDIGYIMSKLPSCFSAMDIARIIKIYYNDIARFTPIDVIRMTMEESSLLSKDIAAFIIGAITDTLYSKILKNPSKDNLERLVQPIYFWEDSQTDPDGEFDPDKTVDEMDELFQTQYERFNPIDESEFKPIDETV